MDTLVRNKPLINIKSGKTIIVTDYVYYEGLCTHLIRFTSGFGADERKDKIELSNSQYNEFLKDHEEKSKFKHANVMETGTGIQKNSSETVKSLNDLLMQSIIDLKQGNMDVETAKTISTLSQTVINSVKVQVEIIKLSSKQQGHAKN